MMESPTTVATFKEWAAQAAERGMNRVYRWYAKFVGSNQCYELEVYGEMLPCHKEGWKLHKKELKELGFAVIKNGPVFLLIVNPDKAEKWREEILNQKKAVIPVECPIKNCLCRGCFNNTTGDCTTVEWSGCGYCVAQGGWSSSEDCPSYKKKEGEP